MKGLTDFGFSPETHDLAYFQDGYGLESGQDEDDEAEDGTDEDFVEVNGEEIDEEDDEEEEDD
jgi:hypothetical protein